MKKDQKIKGPVWNLGLLYKSVNDPQIERDVKKFENIRTAFAKKYNDAKKEFLMDPKVLLQALKDLEAMWKFGDKAISYFYFLRDIEADNREALSKIPLFENRMTKAENVMKFFGVLLGKVSAKKQKEFLADKGLAKYHMFLERIFDEAKYRLSVDEEKIMSLKSMPAYDMWVAGNEKTLNLETVEWKGKKIPVSQATKELQSLDSFKERALLAKAIAMTLKRVAPFSEAEINAVVTNKKINDELRGYKTAYENTVIGYRNDPKVVDNLVKTVTEAFVLTQRFYKIKAKLLKQKSLLYSDRNAKVGKLDIKYPFNKSVSTLKDIFGKIDPKYANILGDYVKNGQIDVHPRVGKTGGAYCAGSYTIPTFVLLNHVGNPESLKTFAHEMGHAFHTEASKVQHPFYFNYSTSLAETASTLFEAIAMDAVSEGLSEKEKIIVLHDEINDSAQTIFRQIACFNYEKEIHETIRTKGFMSKEELADAHNRNMQAYLGPVFNMDRDDGYFFVQWSHIRRFFYVYSYAYGMLVSKALLRKYKKDKSFWKKIEQFLASGGNDTPENIMKKIGIDISHPDFWKEGLKEIEEDIDKLEKLAKTR